MTDVIEIIGTSRVIEVVGSAGDVETIVQPATVIVEVVEQGKQGIPGPPGPPGAATGFSKPAAQALSANRVVVLTSSGQADYADAATEAHRHCIAGITTSSAASGSLVTIQDSGELVDALWSWTPGMPIYCGLNGTITQAVPVTPAAVFSARVGHAISGTSIYIQIERSITL